MGRFRLWRDARGQRIEDKLDTLIAQNALIMKGLTQALKKEDRIMAEIDDLEAAVARCETVEQSAVTLLGTLKSELDAALAGSDADLKARVAALSTKLGSDSDALAAAVVANTPAAPAT